MNDICTHPGCGKPRWRGASGKNYTLSMCEEHQKAAWRKYKAEHPNKNKTGKPKGRPPKRRNPVEPAPLLLVPKPHPGEAVSRAEVPPSITKKAVFDYGADLIIFTDVMPMAAAKAAKRNFDLWIEFLEHCGYEIEIRHKEMEAVG